MATHAHSTRTPLLPLSRSASALLGQGLGRQSGPITQAVHAMRAAEPAISAKFAVLPNGIRTLSRTEVEDLIGGLIDLLDAMDGDTDLEVENEHGGDVQDEPHDPEEDADHWEVGSIGLVTFDGTNYGRVRP